MIIKPKGSVTVPKYPRGLGDLIGWARTVNHAIQQLRDRVFDVPSQLGGSKAAVAVCPFGELETWTTGEGESIETHQGIRGGVIYCGDQNWNITRHEITIGADGSWLLSIPIDVIVNRDDDNEIILPGIKTGTKPEHADWVQTEIVDDTTDYPDNIQPEVDDGAGTITIPIGTITITDSVLSFAKVACGNITIGQCGGVLSHTRG